MWKQNRKNDVWIRFYGISFEGPVFVERVLEKYRYQHFEELIGILFRIFFSIWRNLPNAICMPSFRSTEPFKQKLQRRQPYQFAKSLARLRLSYRITQFCRIKGCGGKGQPPTPPPPPHQTFLKGKTKQGKLCIILKGIYGSFRISLNNCELKKFRDFASWSQKSNWSKFQSFSFDIIIWNLDQLDNKLSEISKLMKLIFIFIRNHH